MSLIRVCLFAFMLMMSFTSMAQVVVDVNTADAQMLAENIKGIGQKKAQAIVYYREKHGPFTSVDELLKVQGIGQKTLENNRTVLTVTQN